jgi:hypothetical protein
LLLLLLWLILYWFGYMLVLEVYISWAFWLRAIASWALFKFNQYQESPS